MGGGKGMRTRKGKHSTFDIQHSTPNSSADADWELHEGGANGRKFDLEERLLEFASAAIDLSEKLPSSCAGNHVAGQILRSGTSPYPNHGESEELIRIFFSSVQTAQKNVLAEKIHHPTPIRHPVGKAGRPLDVGR
jgi:hypothetical protein